MRQPKRSERTHIAGDSSIAELSLIVGHILKVQDTGISGCISNAQWEPHFLLQADVFQVTLECPSSQVSEASRCLRNQLPRLQQYFGAAAWVWREKSR